MSRAIVGKMYEHNLCAVYLLPLLGISKFNFGEDNFINCYVDRYGRSLYVQVKELDDTEEPYHNQHYFGIREIDDRKFIVFTLPDRWKHTFQMFCAGKYSSFTEEAKAVIIQYSGLNWKVPTDRPNITLSDARLLALYRTERLREVIAEELDVATELLDGELVRPPNPSEFFEPF